MQWSSLRDVRLAGHELRNDDEALTGANLFRVGYITYRFVQLILPNETFRVQFTVGCDLLRRVRRLSTSIVSDDSCVLLKRVYSIIIIIYIGSQ
jgi:hypothetical protein